MVGSTIRPGTPTNGPESRPGDPSPASSAEGRLLTEVARRLEQLWSPQEIAWRLALDFPDDPEMRVSHETIYQSLFVQGRGELRRELARCLRSGRTARKPRGRVEKRGRIPGMVMISERPAEAVDRAVPGHWEGDLILGEGGRSAVGTLVERTTRLVLLLHLTEGRSADSVEAAMRKAITTCPRSSGAPSLGTRVQRCPTMSDFTIVDRHPDLLLRSPCSLAPPGQRHRGLGRKSRGLPLNRSIFHWQ